jgi:hypothetical protein
MEVVKRPWSGQGWRHCPAVTYGGDRGWGGDRTRTRNAPATSIMVFAIPGPLAHGVRTYMPSKLIHSSKRKAPATTSVVVADKIKYACDQRGMFGIHKTQSIYQQFAYP